MALSSALYSRPAYSLRSNAWSGVPRALLTSCGLLRRWSCTNLRREFERLCPGGTARGVRVVVDATATIFHTPGEKRAPTRSEQFERLAIAEQQAAQLSAEFGGFASCDVFDLSSPDFDAAAYAVAVKRAEVYYCDVGNTWALLHFLQARGALRSPDGVAARARRGDILYVGNSAGGICGGRTAATATWKNWDDQWGWQTGLPNEVRSNWDEPHRCMALDVAGGASFFPHYEEKWVQLCEDRSKQMDHQVLCCADGHGFVIESGVARRVSPDGVPAHVPIC